MYKYETHCHTALISACARNTPEDIVDLYVKNGYAGVFVTDHFLNGNCVPRIRCNSQTTYEQKIHEFCQGYEEVKKAAKGKLDIFFALEYSYLGTDILIYGTDEESLSKIPEIMKLDPTSFVEHANNDLHLLTVQAHPFREADYIDHIRVFSNVQGIEVYNACRDEVTNKLAEYYCNIKNKIPFAGSDNHAKDISFLGGMEFEEKIQSVEHFIRLVREGKYNTFSQKNVLK